MLLLLLYSVLYFLQKKCMGFFYTKQKCNELMVLYLHLETNKDKQSVFWSVRRKLLDLPQISLDSLGLKSMPVSQIVPSEGEEVTAHYTLFTTEVDQRTDTGP